MIDKLIELSKIFKEGFTVELKEGKLNQYTNYNKPYIVSYRLIIGIGNVVTTYHKTDKIPKNCVIGGWYDKSIDTYFIELNKAFKTGIEAMKFAWKHKQQIIYDIRTGDVIEV